MKIESKKLEDISPNTAELNAENYIYQINDTDFLSYNPSISENEFDRTFEKLLNIESRIGKDETALYINHKWYILNGDHRKEYEKCTNIPEIMAVYQNLKSEFRSAYSTDEEPQTSCPSAWTSIEK